MGCFRNVQTVSVELNGGAFVFSAAGPLVAGGCDSVPGRTRHSLLPRPARRFATVAKRPHHGSLHCGTWFAPALGVPAVALALEDSLAGLCELCRLYRAHGSPV